MTRRVSEEEGGGQRQPLDQRKIVENRGSTVGLTGRGSGVGTSNVEAGIWDLSRGCKASCDRRLRGLLVARMKGLQGILEKARCAGSCRTEGSGTES